MMDARISSAEILASMALLAKMQPDSSIEELCYTLAELLSKSEKMTGEIDLFSGVLVIGAALWRHTDEFQRTSRNR